MKSLTLAFAPPASLQRLMLAIVLALFAGCASHHAQSPASKQAGVKAPGPRQQGIASWYGSEFHRTASGERYDPMSFTAAHRSLPFGTMVRVTNVGTNCCAVVRINNRGPYTRGRIIDVSKAAAMQLKMISSGIARVELEVVEQPDPSLRNKKAGS